jgi:hypothetical protein
MRAGTNGLSTEIAEEWRKIVEQEMKEYDDRQNEY